jgi:hypothetical protein
LAGERVEFRELLSFYIKFILRRFSLPIKLEHPLTNQAERVFYSGRNPLLEMQNDLPLAPQFLQTIIITLAGGEEMDNYVPVICQYPSISGGTFDPRLDFMFGLYFPVNSIHQGTKHAVAGTRANHKIVRQWSNFAYIQ